MSVPSRLSPLVLAAGLLAGPARAGDWPQFKGDAARTGDRPEEALALPMTRVLAVRFPAPIYASPAVAGGRVFVGDARGHLACVDPAAGGKALWVARLDGANNSSSPAVAGGKVFVGSSAGYLAVVDAASGAVLRKIPAEGAVIAAPAVIGKAVYFASVGGLVYKADLDGNLIWSFKAAPALHAEIAAGGDTVLVLSKSAHLVKDEGAQARLLRTVSLPVCASGGPVLLDDARFACQGFDSEGGQLSLGSLAGDKASPTALAADHNDSRVTPSARSGTIYRGDLGAVPGAGRAAIKWKADCPALQPGGFHSSPALSRDHLIVGAEDGRVYFLPLDDGAAAGAAPAWTFATEGSRRDANRAVSSSPAVSGGMVFFGGEDGILYGLGPGAEAPVVDLLPAGSPAPGKRPGAALAGKGTEWVTAGGDMGFSGVSGDASIRPPFAVKWKTRIWSTCKSPVIVAAGTVFVSSRMGQLAALDAESGEILWRTHHGYGEGRGSASYIEGKVLALRGAVDQNGRKNTNRGVWCHEAETGKLLWRKDLPLGYHFNTDGVAADAGKAFVCWNAGGGALQAAAYALEDGRVVWERKYEGVVPNDEPVPVRQACAVGDGRVYFAIAASETLSRRKAKGRFGATIAVKPESGELIWKNADYELNRGMRMSFRKGIVAVFSPDGTHALDAATGTKLWDGRPPTQPLYFGHYYWQPLTDVFLDSRGQKGVCGYPGCTSPVFAGGLWYGHRVKSGPDLIAFEEGTPSPKGEFTPKEVWSYTFLSRTCPPPAPAYGRLYHSPNGEGVVYCFEPKR